MKDLTRIIVKTLGAVQGIRVILSLARHFSRSSQEDFKKDNGEELTQVLCKKDPAEAGTGVCSLLLAQSEVKPHCLLLVLPNKTGEGHICLEGKGGSGAEVRGCWVEVRHRNSERAGAGEQGWADFGRARPEINHSGHQSIF